jgi:cysteine-rich repeat protein
MRNLGVRQSVGSWLLVGMLSGCSYEGVDGIFASDSSGAGGSAASAGGEGGEGGDVGTTTTTSSMVSSSNSTTGVGGGTSTTTGGPVCGDGVADANEACDGGDLKGASCIDQGFANPAGVACSEGCALDYSGCAAACGNGAAEPGEACDGADLGVASCVDVGFLNPLGATCASNCTVDYAGCAPQCGNGGLEPGEACDGADLAGKNCTDVGFVDPMGATCVSCTAVSYATCKATCGNGTIEPGEACDDGNTSNLDACSSTCQTQPLACATATPIAMALGAKTIPGTTAGMNEITPSQSGGGCFQGSGTGPEKVFAVTATTPGFLTAWLKNSGTNYDSVLYARTSCDNPQTQVLCHDNFTPNSNLDAGEVIGFRMNTNDTVYLFVDGYNGAAGTFELELDLSVGDNCADPVPVTVEGTAAVQLLGSTAGYVSDGNASNCNGAGFGPDVVYQMTTIAADNYTFATNTSTYNSVTYARSDCALPNTEIACSSPDNSFNSTIQPSLPANAVRYLWVDGTQNQAGSYRLYIQH